MQKITFINLEEKIKEIFLHQHLYQLSKYIHEYHEGSTFIGDFWVYLMFEPAQDKPPTFYSVMTPYDVISKKASYQAVVFRNGQTILSIPFHEYVNMRTGIMDSILLRAMGLSSIENRKILYIGTGHVARISLQALHVFFPEIHAIDFINTRREDPDFKKLANDLSITVSPSEKGRLNEYDYIFCHTSAGAGNILTDEDKVKIKPGTIITTFVSSPGNTELSESFFDTKNANIIIDWEESITGTKELKNAIASQQVEKEKLIMLEDLFAGSAHLNTQATYTIYRSTGTPMQNLAVLKMLIR